MSVCEILELVEYQKYILKIDGVINTFTVIKIIVM